MAEWLTGWVTGWVTARVTDLDLDAMHQELVAVLRELRHALFVQSEGGVLLPPVGHLHACVRTCGPWARGCVGAWVCAYG